jgi:hypothetical protein
LIPFLPIDFANASENSWFVMDCGATAFKGPGMDKIDKMGF